MSLSDPQLKGIACLYTKSKRKASYFRRIFFRFSSDVSTNRTFEGFGNLSRDSQGHLALLLVFEAYLKSVRKQLEMPLGYNRDSDIPVLSKLHLVSLPNALGLVRECLVFL
jgi:hypothetical protein